MNPKDYILAIKQGDKDAFSALFHLYYSPLCAFMRSYTRDLDSAEEIVQKTFFMLWQKREKLEIHTSVKSYLYQMARNNFLQVQKQRNKQNLLLEKLKFEALETESKLDEEEQERKIQLLKSIIEKLPPRCKEVLLLKQEGLKYREIATHLDISVKSVESQMRIAFKKIKKEFERNAVFLILFFTDLIHFL